MTDTSKRCLECGETKPLTEFYFSKLGRQSRSSKCKACFAPYFQEYYKKHMPDFNRRAKESYARMTPERKHRKDEWYKAYCRDTPIKALGKNIRRALRRRPTENPITVIELMEMWEQQGGKCAVSGVTMTWAQGAYSPTSLSLDRINRHQGYIKGNIRLVCYQINAFRGMWSDEQMFSMARNMIANVDYELTQAAA